MKKLLRPYALDLFGDVIILESELIDWAKTTAPHIAHSDRRIQQYIKDWNVIEKIRRAKIEEAQRPLHPSRKRQRT